jgi:Ala-tRNA(Pro) deacylase
MMASFHGGKAMNVSDFLHNRNAKLSNIKRRAAQCAIKAAEALEDRGRGMVKSVLLRADHGYCYMLAVLPSEKRIDLNRLSTALGGSRLEVASEQELRRLRPRGEQGALSPFGSKYGVNTVVDDSLANRVEVVFHANARGEDAQMGFEDYRRTEYPLLLSFACDEQVGL